LLYRTQSQILVLIFFSLQKCFDEEGEDREDEDVEDVQARSQLGEKKTNPWGCGCG